MLRFQVNFWLLNLNLITDNKIFDREDISFHFSLGFTALMRRFTGNKTNYFFQNNANKFLANQHHQLDNNKLNDDEQSYQKNAASRYQNSVATSNLNSFSFPTDQTSNLLVVLQGFQMATSRSNVVLIAVGGIVRTILIRK